ncbi:site-2 protease family protein [Aggregicoccus sp. 17bor-14]|uniref:M50 family metallopeptidase n=1 Tax=Myxococcaceae TaxID=31 RepID=UPI00129C2563|nr:site-2 protease family protein [Simulacricoccus sp. 17bor-14]MRI90710.1 site-2 protease family protein [Aggregicoccus sp. 17bor-14]
MRYLYALLALGLLLAVHELGHLVMARLLGLRVERFSFGFGPALLDFRAGRTRVTVAAVPLGGAVLIRGMNPHEQRADPEDPASFVALPRWRRALVHLAGPLTNYLVALAVLAGLYAAGTHVPVPLAIGTVEPGSEAARAQLVPGDVIRQVEGSQVARWSEFVEAVAAHPGQPLHLTVERAGERREVLLTPRPGEQGAGRVGVTQQYVYRAHPLPEALRLALLHTGRIASEGVDLVVGLAQGHPGRELAGPTALVRQASEATTSGLDTFLRLLVSVSVALCLFYLLPIPSLDGGRVLLLALEGLTGRAVNRRVQTLLQTLGFLLLVGAVVAIAASELRRGLRLFQAPAAAPAPAARDAGLPSVLPRTDGGLPTGGAVPPGR